MHVLPSVVRPKRFVGMQWSHMLMKKACCLSRWMYDSLTWALICCAASVQQGHGVHRLPKIMSSVCVDNGFVQIRPTQYQSVSSYVVLRLYISLSSFIIEFTHYWNTRQHSMLSSFLIETQDSNSARGITIGLLIVSHISISLQRAGCVNSIHLASLFMHSATTASTAWKAFKRNK